MPRAVAVRRRAPRPLPPRPTEGVRFGFPPLLCTPLLVGVVLFLVLPVAPAHPSLARPPLPGGGSDPTALPVLSVPPPGSDRGASPSPSDVAAVHGAPDAAPPAGHPWWGWPTPRGPVSQNGSTPGFAPEVNLTTGRPSVLAQVDLGWAGANATGMSTAAGAPLFVALRNGTLWALNASSLGTDWWASIAPDTIAAGPTVASGEVFVVGSSGHLYAWNVTTGLPLWARNLGSADLGAAPLPAEGNLYLLTRTNLSVVNISTRSLLYQGPNASADPNASLAFGGASLFAQGEGMLVNFSLFGQIRGLSADLVGHGGSALYSDGEVAVAGDTGTIGGCLLPCGGWFHHLELGTALLPAAASNGELFVTNGSDPIWAFGESTGARIWRSPFNATSAPVVAGSTVFAGAWVNHTGPEVVALNASTGALAWGLPVPTEVHAAPIVANGLLYVLDARGNLSALGAPPLVLAPIATNRSGGEAAVGSPVEFSTSLTGGAGAPSTITWTFSDGGTATGPVVSYAFTAPGEGWASAVAVDSEGVASEPVTVPFDVLPRLAATVEVDRTSGTLPLWVNLTAQPSGGDGTYTIAFQVTGDGAGWYVPALFTYDLELTQTGTATVVAWVNDSSTAGDHVISPAVEIEVLPAAFAPPAITVAGVAPGVVRVLWSASQVPGFEAYLINISADHGAWLTVDRLTDPNSTGALLTGLLLVEHLAVNVTLQTTYGEFTSSTTLVTPTAAPILGVSQAQGLPGEAELSWSTPAPVDGLSNWVLWETPPGASVPNLILLPPGNSTLGGSAIVGPFPNLETTTFAIEFTSYEGQGATSPTVPFTPAWVPPTLVVTSSGLTLNVSWPAIPLSDFAYLWVCTMHLVSGVSVSTCPVNSTAPASSGTSVSVNTTGTYEVYLEVFAADGFALRSSNATVTVALPATAPWFETSVLDMPLWSFLIIVLLVVVILGVLSRLYRERREIPAYIGEVEPWDPLAHDLEPKAKPKDPETLDVTSKVHRHPASHSHRHLQRHRSEEAEGTAAPADRDEDGSPRAVPIRVKKGSVRSAPEPKDDEQAEKPERSSDDEDDEIDQVGSEGPSPRPRPTAPSRPADDATASKGSEEGRGELTKLPVVLRHRDAEGRSEDSLSALKPRRSFFRRAPAAQAPDDEEGSPGAKGDAAGRSKKGGAEPDDDEGGEDDGPATAPKTSKPRTKPSEEEPTL